MTAEAGQGSAPVQGRARVAGRWSVVPAVSHARFHVRDKLVTTVHGSLPVEDGRVVLVDGGTVTHAWVSLAVSGIETGNARRDRDLLKPRLLDAARFPSVRVEVVTAASPRGSAPPKYQAHAVVQARGRSAPLVLTARTVDQAVARTAAQAVAEPGDANVGGSDGEVRIRVTGRLDRTALGIAVPSFVVGRFLDLEADLVLRVLPAEPGGI